MKKIEAAVDSAMRSRMYGKIEIEFQAGAPMYLRELKQEKLVSETPRGANSNGTQTQTGS
jgi:hypothetical protein